MTTGLIDRDINGVTYNFEQFNTTLALKTLTRLTRLIGEPLAIALGGASTTPPTTPGGASAVKTKIADREISGETLGKAVHALIERLDDKEVLSLFELLTAEKVLCNGGKIVFNDHYRGNITLMFKVFMTALEVQYGNFMDVLSEKPKGDLPPGGLKAK